MLRPSFLKLIGRSPVKGLRKHMGFTAEAAKLLLPFFDAVFEKDKCRLRAIFEEIVDLEHRADECKRKWRLKVRRNLMLKLPRNEILQLLHVQEKSINLIRNITGIFVGRNPSVPETIVPSFRQFIKLVEQSVAQAYLAVCELDDLVDAGYLSVFRKHVLEAANELDHIEHRADALEEELRYLFCLEEQNIDPVDTMFLYQSFERLGRLADISEEIGSMLVLLVNR